MNIRCHCGKTFLVVEHERASIRCHICGRLIPLAWLWWERRTDPEAMLAQLRPTCLNRRFFIFGATLYRSDWSRLRADEQAAIELIEAHADGRASEGQLAQAEGGVAVPRPYDWGLRTLGPPDELPGRIDVGRVREIAHAVRFAHAALSWREPDDDFYDFPYPSPGRQWVTDVMRCVCGNPFAPVRVLPAWRTETVTDLARVIDARQSFDLFPILADAVQDEGCEDEWMLAHCRGPGPHVRGCLVIDALLGRE